MRFIPLCAPRLPVLIVAACVLAVPASAASQPPPNILVILTDDQGAAEYSAAGTKELRTPNLDRLFREGVAFRNFRTNSCVCSPTITAKV